jgi:hypothetical protein
VRNSEVEILKSQSVTGLRMDFVGFHQLRLQDSRSQVKEFHIIATPEIAKSEKAKVSGEKGLVFGISGFRG